MRLQSREPSQQRRAPRRDPRSGEIPMRPNAWPVVRSRIPRDVVDKYRITKIKTIDITGRSNVYMQLAAFYFKEMNEKEMDEMTDKDRKIIEDNIQEGFYVGYAYLYPSDGGKKQEYVFDMTPKNIANFIGAHQLDAQKIILTDMVDRKILDTIGGFIDHCTNQDLCRDVVRILAPIQMGETEAEEVPMVSREAYDEYCNMEEEMVARAEVAMYMREG